MSDFQQRFEKIISKIDEPSVERKFYPSITAENNSGPQPPAWIINKTLYEVYVRAFSKEGTFKAVKEKLPVTKALGIDVLWFMPIFPIGIKQRKGTLGCPYSVRDYYTVNPEYGSEKDFKKLISEAHKLDIKIVIDLVANHVAHDYIGFAADPDLVLKDKKGNPTRKIADWTDVVDLDYAYKNASEHVYKIMRHWLEEYNVDGFRCDVAGLVPLSFWEWSVPQLQKIKPDIYLLAEGDGPLLHTKAFHSTYDWVLYELMQRVQQGKESAHILLEWQDIRKNIYPKNALPLRFVENHDKKRATEVFDKSIIPFIVFIFTMDGIPLLYNGQEIGAKEYLSLFDKQEIDWNKDVHLKAVYSQLIKLRKSHTAFASGTIIKHVHNKIPDVLIYEKSANEHLLVIINIRDEQQLINCDRSICKKIATGRELLNTADSIIKNQNHLILKPYQSVIYKFKE